MPTTTILFFLGCSEVNSTWLITSELANQRARKVLFTCVVYTKYTEFIQDKQYCFFAGWIGCPSKFTQNFVRLHLIYKYPNYLAEANSNI